MQQVSATMQALSRPTARGTTATDQQQALMRGLINGAVISLVLWAAIGYVAFALH